VVAAPEVSDGVLVEAPLVELEPAPAPESVGVFTWPAAPPKLSELVEGAGAVAPDDIEPDDIEPDGIAPDVVESVVAPELIELELVDGLVVVDAAALAEAPVVAAMLPPDHQSREARSFGEAAR